MRRLQHEAWIGRGLADGGLFLRLRAPEHKADRLRKLRDGGDDGVGEALPAEVPVAVGPAGLNGQDGVEQENALPRPRRQTAAGKRRQTEVGLQLLADILQRRRQLHPLLHREGQTMRLARLMIRVLPKDHDPHPFRRREGKSVEYVRLRRKNGRVRVSVRDLFLQLLEVRCVQLLFQQRHPRAERFQIRHGKASLSLILL